MTHPAEHFPVDTYPNRSPNDLLSNLQFVDRDRAEQPDAMGAARDVDIVYYGPRSEVNGHRYIAHNAVHDVAILKAEERGYLTPGVSQLVGQRTLQYGKTDKNFDSTAAAEAAFSSDGIHAHIGSGYGQTFVAFPASASAFRDDRGVSCTFIMPGEGHTFEEVMTTARAAFPVLFETIDSGAKILAPEHPTPIPEREIPQPPPLPELTESQVRARLRFLLSDMRQRLQFARVERRDDSPMTAEQMLPAFMAANEWSIQNTMYTIGIDPSSRDRVNGLITEFCQLPDDQREDWLADKGLDKDTEMQAYRNPNPAAQSQAPRARERLKRAYDRVGEAILNLGKGRTEQQKAKARRIAAVAGAIAAGTVATVGTIYALKQGLPGLPRLSDFNFSFLRGGTIDGSANSSTEIVQGAADALKPDSGGPVQADELVNYGALVADATPSPQFITETLKDGETVWGYAKANLPPGASIKEVWDESVRIMEASGIPTNAEGPDPLAAARNLQPGQVLHIPVHSLKG